jgi:hypothetical protein
MQPAPCIWLQASDERFLQALGSAQMTTRLVTSFALVFYAAVKREDEVSALLVGPGGGWNAVTTTLKLDAPAIPPALFSGATSRASCPARCAPAGLCLARCGPLRRVHRQQVEPQTTTCITVRAAVCGDVI